MAGCPLLTFDLQNIFKMTPSVLGERAVLGANLSLNCCGLYSALDS